MAYPTSRIGAGGMVLRRHDVERNSRARMFSQDRSLVYLLTPAGLR
jgi:hypothetical protein